MTKVESSGLHAATAETLLGKVVLITGASSGVGATIAHVLAERGAKVALAARRADLLSSVVQTCGGDDCALAIAADLTEESDVQRAVDASVTRFERLDAVILNAAVGLIGGIEEFSLSNWQRVLATNVTSAFLVARAAIPHLRATQGTMIAIGSELSYGVMPGLGAYAASKWALLALMRTLALELRPQGIRVSSILPGGILTDFGPETREGKLQRQALGEKFLQPRDVAEAVRFLLMQPESVWTEELRIWSR